MRRFPFRTVAWCASGLAGAAVSAFGGSAVLHDTTGPNYFEFEKSVYFASESVGIALIPIDFMPGNRGWSGSVGFSATAGTATAGVDFEPTNGVAYFSGPSARYVSIPITKDDVLDPDETVLLKLHASTGSVLGRSEATLQIIDASVGRAAFVRTTYEVPNSNGTARIELVRTGGNAGRISMDYFTEPIDAMRDVDFTHVMGTLEFQDGQTNAFVDVPIVHNAAATSSRRFKVLLWDAVDGAYIETPSAEVVIEGSAPPRLEIDVTTAGRVISWPASAAGFALEKCSGLQRGDWGAVTTQPAQVDDRCTIIEPISDVPAFYRLRRTGE